MFQMNKSGCVRKLIFIGWFDLQCVLEEKPGKLPELLYGAWSDVQGSGSSWAPVLGTTLDDPGQVTYLL